jgi:ATP-dependent helicase/nuclease subunit B
MLASIMLVDISIRPAFGRHPRVAIYGLLEARLQSADSVHLRRPQRRQLAATAPARSLARAAFATAGSTCPGSIAISALAAHDLASALGAPEVVLTRARRDRSGPTIASRFLLRLQALMGDRLRWKRNATALGKATGFQAEGSRKLSAPRTDRPIADQRKVAISITQMDMLKADPYAFYAAIY